MMLSVVPIWTVSAVVLFYVAPWRIAAGHLIALGLFGIILADMCLSGFQKIPFTCSYLPGKSPAHRAFLTVWGTLLFMATAVEYEVNALRSPARFAVMLAILCVAASCARWWAVSRANLPEAGLRFEELDEPTIFALNMHRDGRMSA